MREAEKAFIRALVDAQGAMGPINANASQSADPQQVRDLFAARPHGAPDLHRRTACSASSFNTELRSTSRTRCA